MNKEEYFYLSCSEICLMRVLIDTGLIPDLLQNRPPFSIEARQIWNINRSKRFDGYIAAITPLNVSTLPLSLNRTSTTAVHPACHRVRNKSLVG